jgi:hypothetical protein
MTDPRVHDVVGPLAHTTYIDCTVSPIPHHRFVGREIQRLFDSSPIGGIAFGLYFLTNARGDVVYGVRPCRCQCLTGIRNAADLLRMRGRDDIYDPDGDFHAMEAAAARFRAHSVLRERAHQAGEPEPAAPVDPRCPDPLVAALPCRMVDGGRAAILTLGCVTAAGGSMPGVAHVLDPHASTAPELRERFIATLTAAIRRDDPYPEATGPHLAMTYLVLAQDEIAPAVEAACAERGCTPEELPLHALPVPRAALERAALLVCESREIPVVDGRQALDRLLSGDE